MHVKTFYEYVKRYKGKTNPTDESRLADWIYSTDDFPKFSTDFHEISNFLEIYSPFPEAIHVFDALWEKYEADQSHL